MQIITCHIWHGRELIFVWLSNKIVYMLSIKYGIDYLIVLYEY